MSEIFQASLFGFNLLPTLFLGLALIYWLTVIAGVLDHSMFDLNLDTDIDVDLDVDTGVDLDGAADGVLHSILVFFNLGEIPLMLFLSFVFLIMWVGSVLVKVMIDTNVFMSGVLLIPEFIGALFITKILLFPFRKFFKALKTMDSGITVLQKKCRLITDLEPGRIGQAEILTNGAPVFITVRNNKNISMKKGNTALVIQKDKSKDIYEIIPYEEITPLLKQEV